MTAGHERPKPPADGARRVRRLNARSTLDGLRNGRAAPSAQELRILMRDALTESRLTPNAISVTGFTLNLAAAALVVGGYFFLAGLAFIAGSVMDVLDGRYSRMSGKGSPFGAFLDSTLDRVAEGMVLGAIAFHFAEKGQEVATVAVFYAFVGSMMVSYTRARAEAMGVKCTVGIASRPVRVVILSAGLIFARGAGIGDFELLAPAIYLMALLTTATVGQRVWHVRGELKGDRPAAPES